VRKRWKEFALVWSSPIAIKQHHHAARNPPYLNWRITSPERSTPGPLPYQQTEHTVENAPRRANSACWVHPKGGWRQILVPGFLDVTSKRLGQVCCLAAAVHPACPRPPAASRDSPVTSLPCSTPLHDRRCLWISIRRTWPLASSFNRTDLFFRGRRPVV